MRDIAAMTERIVKKAKEYDRDTVPGDYATLHTPCPHCGGVVKENYRRYACTGKAGDGTGAAAASRSPRRRPGAPLPSRKPSVSARRAIGPLEGFRSKAGWPFVAELALVRDDESGNFKLEFDFGDDAKAAETGEIVDLSAEANLGPCPKCGAPVKAFGKSYVCEKSVPTEAQPVPSCDFKSGQIILQQPVEPEQMKKLLQDGKTDLLDKFVSMRTRRAFKARLAWSAEEGKVIFEFEPREGGRKYPPRKTARRLPRPLQNQELLAQAGRAPRPKKPLKRHPPRKPRPRPRKPRAPATSSPARPGRRHRRRPLRPWRGDEAAVGLHQGPQPARPERQAHHRRRRQAQTHLRRRQRGHVQAGGDCGGAAATLAVLPQLRQCAQLAPAPGGTDNHR
jgi:DNA topoisomerase-3